MLLDEILLYDSYLNWICCCTPKIREQIITVLELDQWNLFGYCTLYEPVHNHTSWYSLNLNSRAVSWKQVLISFVASEFNWKFQITFFADFLRITFVYILKHSFSKELLYHWEFRSNYVKRIIRQEMPTREKQ